MGNIPYERPRLVLLPRPYDQLNSSKYHSFDFGFASIPPRPAIDGEKAAYHVWGRSTWAVCKAIGHEGDCPEDPNYIALMVAAATAGY